MNKYTTGQKLKLTHNIDAEILRTSSFSGVEHYAVIYHIGRVGQPTETSFGWMPVAIIDTMDVIPL